MIILLSFQIGLAQDFINYHSRSAADLNLEQQTYLRMIKEEATTAEVTIATIDFDQLNSTLLNLTLPDGSTHLVQKESEESLDMKRSLTVGRTLRDEGEVHFIQNGDMLTGHININGTIHYIRPLKNGTHAIIRMAQENLKGCSPNERDDVGEETSPEEIERMIPPKYKSEGYVQNDSRNATGDSHTRVLVAYTKAVGEALADPLSTVHLAISITNTGYANSGITQRIKLARAIEVDYAESGRLGTELSRFRSSTDGIMDTVHVERQRWRADMCHLLVSTGEYAGIAYTSSGFGSTFAVTFYPYINNYTFNHEIGHNHGCHHSGGYGHPSGYFRTVMAYQSSCGAGACGRVNEFSGPDDTYYYEPTSTSYPTGTESKNNVARHNSRVATIANHYPDYDTANYEGMTIPDDEAVHALARMNLQNNPNSEEDFIYEDGAEGSFTAGLEVTLKPGFWAKSGSEFEGKIEEYGPALENSTESDLVADAVEGEYIHGDEVPPFFANSLDMKAYPNPVREQMTIDYQLTKDESLRLYVRNTLGQVVKVLYQGRQAVGQHRAQLQAGSLAKGVYYLTLETSQERKVEKIVVAGSGRM